MLNSRKQNKLKINFTPYFFIFPAVLAMLILVYYPLIKGIYYSFTNMTQYNIGTPFIKPSYNFVGLKNYFEALRDPYLGKIFKQTVVWTFFNLIFHTFLGLFLACLLNRQFKGRTIYRLILLIPWAVPSFISAFSWRFIFNYDYGLINLCLVNLGFKAIPWLSNPFWAMTSAIITNVWLGVPFMMVIMLGGLQSIPHELYEAVTVDGGNRFHKFIKITLPLLQPVALPSILLGVIWTFNMFNVIYLVTSGGPYHSSEILVTFAYKQAFENWNFGAASTYGVIILSILIVFTFIYQQFSKKAEGIY
ncbi:MAG: sugar ABC transporter permease [Armatimonadetes bacterium]|nr:sugar ABC transporter permease [Armatimonadota bacterium]